MYLKSLLIKNFKSVKSELLEFDKLNIFSGSNGAGKSSIIEALCYLLTGHLNENLSNYISWGKEEFILNLKFSHENKDFEYSVKVSKKGGSHKILKIQDQEYLNSEASKKLEEYINPLLTLYSSISLQLESSDILFDTSANRLNKLKSLLGMDRITEISKQISLDSDEFKSKLAILDSELFSLSERHFIKIEVPEQYDVESLREELKDLEDSLERVEKAKIELKEIQIKEKLQNENSSVLLLTKNVLEKTISTQKTELNSLIVKRLSKLDFTEEDIALEEEKELKVSIRLSELEKSLELVLKGKCPTCGKEYKDDPERIKSEIKELKQVLNEVKKSIKDRKSKIEEYNEASRNNGLISQKKSLLEKILKEKESELIEVNSKIENLSGEFFGDKKKSLGEIISSFDEDKYLEVVKQIDVWEERQKEIQRATEFNKKIEKEELEIKDRIETKTKEKENVAYKKAILDKSKSLLDKEFSSYLLEKGLDAVENNLNDFFFRTYSKYSIYLKRDKKSVEFFYSPDKGNILSAVGTASGFEKQLLAIAFRIALSNLHNLGFLILDEIDESAENSNSIELYKNIMEMEFNQLFIVTHKESTIDFLLNDYKAKIFNFYEGEITIEN